MPKKCYLSGISLVRRLPFYVLLPPPLRATCKAPCRHIRALMRVDEWVNRILGMLTDTQVETLKNIPCDQRSMARI